VEPVHHATRLGALAGFGRRNSGERIALSAVTERFGRPADPTVAASARG